jgi:hypothetical protein
MKLLKTLFPWKSTLLLSICILLVLNVLSFYGMYTNKFYFFKPDNYIFPLLSLVHFVFLYVMWFKVKEGELSDPPMRNLEFVLYFISLVYLFKLGETAYVLSTADQYENHLIPATFMPVGILMLVLYATLLLLTFLTFSFRRQLVGTYLFDDTNQHVDNWNS